MGTDYSIIKYDGYEILTKNEVNPTLNIPSAETDLTFYQTRATLMDPERYKSFLKNAERRFRASKEYKTYKSLLMSMGIDHCQVMGNIEASEEVDIELHHNILNLFDICILISEHCLNTIGRISTFDLIQLLIYEHFSHRVGCTFLSCTAHEMYTNDPDAYIPPEQTWGKWWELIEIYKHGITYDIANKLIRYIGKYQNQLPNTINIIQQEQILNFAYINEYGTPIQQVQLIGPSVYQDQEDFY